jgi:hypothetical protein
VLCLVPVERWRSQGQRALAPRHLCRTKVISPSTRKGNAKIGRRTAQLPSQAAHCPLATQLPLK